MTDPIARLNAALEGRYLIERELGEGGMATVYLADDLKHDRRVALKVLKPELAAVVGAERFLAEIKTTANLQHPHILPLFDSGEAENNLFYVMPYVEGETLRDRLDREKQLPVDAAVLIATNVAEALDYAHRQGVIHRDIKPANILLQDGKPIIADFGIALAVGAAGQGRMTETGLSVGTPHYMSPEQAMGEAHVGPASDLYALGCVLYEMLVGEPPFTGGSAQAVLGKIIATEAPSARLQRKAVPANVDAVVRRSLEKLPADRFSSAQGFAHALAVPGFRHGESDAVASRGLGLGKALAVGVTAGVMGLLAGWALLGGGPEQIEFGDVRKVTFDPGLELMPAISPDGQDLAYVGTASSLGPARVLVRSLSGGPPTDLTDEPSGSEQYPQWSADGTTISYDAGGVPRQVGARGGTPRPILQVDAGADVRTGSWSPDGSRFAYVRFDEESVGIYLRQDQVERRLAEGLAHSLQWSPDGRWIAYVDENPSWARLGQVFGNVAPSAVMVVAAEGGDPVVVAPAEDLNVSPAFLPDGRLLFVSARGGMRDIYLVELRRDGTPAGEARRITAGLNPHHISVSADGRRLAFGTLSRRQNVYQLPIPTSGAVSAYSGTPAVAGSQVIEGMAVSPDGQWLAFDSDRAGAQTVFRRRLSGGGEALPVTTSPEDAFVRSWSRDGSLIAGHGFNEGVRDIWVADPDGLSFRFVSPGPFSDRYPDISPDGRRIAFDSFRDDRGTNEIFVMEVDAAGQWGPATRAGPGSLARWSPDGRTIASTDQGRLTLIPADGGEARVVPIDGVGETLSVTSVEWLSDQRLLVQWVGAGGITQIGSVSSTGGPVRELVRFDDPGRQPRHEIAVHDGTLFYTLGEFEADIWLMEILWR